MTELALPPTIAAAQAASLRSRFFSAASILMLLLVLAGFAPTFYLRGYFPSVRPVAAYVYWHGAVMTAWYVLFVVQTSLVAAHRADLHKRLGIAGCVLAAAVLATGFYVNRNLAPRLTALGVQLPPATEQLVTRVVLMGLFGLAIFTIFIIAAVLLRTRRAAHARLMFLAVLSTIPAAVGPPRWLDAALTPLLPAWLGLGGTVTLAALTALAWHDWFTERRLHAATLWGGLALITLPRVSRLVADTEAAHDFVWLAAGQ